MKNTLVKYNQHRDLFDQLTSSIFSDVFHDPFFAKSRNWRLEDVYETEKDYVFEVELPRFSAKDIKVTASKNGVSVVAKNDKGQYSRYFEYSNADAEKADVKLELGVLKITVPKVAVVEPQVKELEVKEIK